MNYYNDHDHQFHGGSFHSMVISTEVYSDDNGCTVTVQSSSNPAIPYMQGRHQPHFGEYHNNPYGGSTPFTYDSDPYGPAVTPFSNPHGHHHSNKTYNTDEFYRESLDAHNRHRNKHRAAPLQLNHELCDLAQKWVDHLARTDTFDHSSTNYRGDQVGNDMTKAWYDEIERYDYRNPTSTSGTGHFTQVVWKGSREVGFAQAKGSSMTYAVAMYYPPGNREYHFEENVSRPH